MARLCRPGSFCIIKVIPISGFCGTLVVLQAEIVTAEECTERTSELQRTAESGNMTGYQHREDSPEPSLYVLDLEGTDDAYILFTVFMSDDFDHQIKYFVDDQETVPDMNFEYLK